MSAKISVVCVFITLIALLFFSCSPSYETEYKSIFEKSFSVEITVKTSDTEYKASIRLAEIPSPDTEGGADTSVLRDASVVYTYPDTADGLSAKREGGKTSLNVSGIEIVPSENIAKKYMFTADLLDIRAERITDIKTVKTDGVELYEMSFEHEGQRYKAIVSKESKVPISIEGADMKITVNSFLYT